VLLRRCRKEGLRGATANQHRRQRVVLKASVAVPTTTKIATTATLAVVLALPAAAVVAVLCFEREKDAHLRSGNSANRHNNNNCSSSNDRILAGTAAIAEGAAGCRSSRTEVEVAAWSKRPWNRGELLNDWYEM
jgi:hypothetical protein